MRPIKEAPQVELRVVDPVREDGPKLVEVSPEAAVALRASQPGLRLEAKPVSSAGPWSDELACR